jgi:hypothetical protein
LGIKNKKHRLLVIIDGARLSASERSVGVGPSRSGLFNISPTVADGAFWQVRSPLVPFWAPLVTFGHLVIRHPDPGHSSVYNGRDGADGRFFLSERIPSGNRWFFRDLRKGRPPDKAVFFRVVVASCATPLAVADLGVIFRDPRRGASCSETRASDKKL